MDVYIGTVKGLSARKFRIIFLQGTFLLYFLVVVSRELFLGLKAPSLLDKIEIFEKHVFFALVRPPALKCLSFHFP